MTNPDQWNIFLELWHHSNIIFTDPHYISRPVSHDHKLVDREVDNYPIALRQGITTLYLRKM